MEALLEAEFHGALPAAEVPDAAVDAHVLELCHRLQRRVSDFATRYDSDTEMYKGQNRWRGTFANEEPSRFAERWLSGL